MIRAIVFKNRMTNTWEALVIDSFSRARFRPLAYPPSCVSDTQHGAFTAALWEVAAWRFEREMGFR